MYDTTPETALSFTSKYITVSLCRAYRNGRPLSSYRFIFSYDKEENFLAYQIETDVFKRDLYAARGNLHLLKEKYGKSDRYFSIQDVIDMPYWCFNAENFIVMSK